MQLVTVHAGRRPIQSGQHRLEAFFGADAGIHIVPCNFMAPRDRAMNPDDYVFAKLQIGCGKDWHVGSSDQVIGYHRSNAFPIWEGSSPDSPMVSRRQTVNACLLGLDRRRH